MSLFEDSQYVYRDTFFVFFPRANRPSAEQVKSILDELGDNYDIRNLKSVDGKLESLSVYSPQDYSAMDITYVGGDEVTEQINELLNDFKSMTLTGDDRQKIAVFDNCDARFDVFHFEQVSEGEEETEVLDPGGLLLVLERLARLCQGVSLDPQSQTLL